MTPPGTWLIEACGHARYDQTYTQYKKGEFRTLIHSVRRQWKKALKTALQ